MRGLSKERNLLWTQRAQYVFIEVLPVGILGIACIIWICSHCMKSTNLQQLYCKLVGSATCLGDLSWRSSADMPLA